MSALEVKMLSNIAAITIPLLLLMFVAFFIFENNRKKQLAAQKLALSTRISDAKNSYKVDVERFCEETQLTTKVRDQLYTIANNYFVYQSISDDSVAVFEITVNKLSQSYSQLLHHFNDHDDLETVQERIELFVDNLPTQPRGYNAGFYQNSLTTLNHLLMIPESALENTDNDEHSNEEKINDNSSEQEYDQARSA